MPRGLSLNKAALLLSMWVIVLYLGTLAPDENSPSAPVLYEATTNALVVQWESPLAGCLAKEPCRFELAMRPSGKTAWTVVASRELTEFESANTVRRTVENLDPGSTYEFRVRHTIALGDFGELKWGPRSPLSKRMDTLVENKDKILTRQQRRQKRNTFSTAPTLEWLSRASKQVLHIVAFAPFYAILTAFLFPFDVQLLSVTAQKISSTSSPSLVRRLLVLCTLVFLLSLQNILPFTVPQFISKCAAVCLAVFTVSATGTVCIVSGNRLWWTFSAIEVPFVQNGVVFTTGLVALYSIFALLLRERVAAFAFSLNSLFEATGRLSFEPFFLIAGYMILWLLVVGTLILITLLPFGLSLWKPKRP